MGYLLAAEADKIQDLIFRSSRLREVVGASQLLSNFCTQEGMVVALAKQHRGKLVVNDGGSFRVLFEGEDPQKDAVAFGLDLAELYRLQLDGTLSVAEPVKLDSSASFRETNQRAGRNLRRAKNHRQGATAEVHMPFVALCRSCGIALANQFGTLRLETEEEGRYLCRLCQAKAAERSEKRIGYLDLFLESILNVRSDESVQNPDMQNNGSETKPTTYGWPEDTDEVANFDPLNYVAYLVADGNGMGALFGMCSQEQIERLSQELTIATRDSLATATRMLLKCLPPTGEADKGYSLIPVLPLILGGDDLFALIPAPYSLDFAQHFCQAWENRLRTLLNELKFVADDNKIPPPTISAAVIICKSKYPYTLAHHRAESLLKEAKRQSKLLASEKGEHLSVVNFEVILGNRLAGHDESPANGNDTVMNSLRPYWVTQSELSANAKEYGIGLKTLLAQRYALKDVSNKRLVSVRRSFENVALKTDRNTLVTDMVEENKALHALELRNTKKPIENALCALGKTPGEDAERHFWVKRKHGKSTIWAHGMLDLLEAWGFAQEFPHKLEDYKPEETEQ